MNLELLRPSYNISSKIYIMLHTQQQEISSSWSKLFSPIVYM